VLWFVMTHGLRRRPPRSIVNKTLLFLGYNSEHWRPSSESYLRTVAARAGLAAARVDQTLAHVSTWWMHLSYVQGLQKFYAKKKRSMA